VPSDVQEAIQIGAAGLNLRDSPLEVGVSGLIDSLNWRLDQRGALVKRLGYKQGSLSAFGTRVVLEMATFDPSTSASTTALLGYCNDGTIVKNVGTVTIKSGLDTSAVPSFAQMLDKIYWSNGVDPVSSWDGTTVVDITGVNDVQTITTTGTPTGGTFTLTYPPTGATTVPIAYNASAATVQSALLTILGAGTVACTGGALPTGVVCTFQGTLANTNLQTLTHSDNLTGGSSPTVVVTHTTAGRGDAPRGKYLAVWRNRLWVAGVAANPNRVYWSGAGDPTVWTTTNFVDIHDPRGDFITSIFPSPNIGTDADGADGVLVYKQRSAHRIIDDADNILGTVSGGANVMIDASTGALTHRSVKTLNGRVYSVGKNGIYSTDGHSSLVLESDQLGTLIPNALTATGAANLLGLAYQGSYLVAATTLGGASNTLLLELCATLGRTGGHPIMAHTIPVGAMTIFTDSTQGQQAIITTPGDGNGRAYFLFQGGTDGVLTTPITATATTGVSQFGLDAVKRMRRIRAVGRGSLTIGVLADFITGTGDQQIFTGDVSSTAPYWNQVNWNQFNWAGQGDSGVLPVSRYFGTRGRWFGFVVSESSSSVSQSTGALGTTPIPTGGAVLQQMQCTLTPLGGEV